MIYHPGLGGTFDDNAVACEYLASHGYVVVSSAYEAADSSSLNIDGDLATSLDDLEFLLRYAATLPLPTASRVAAMGHSYGAQAMLAWRARPNSALDAVVFLDSTVEYRPLDDSPAFKAALERNRNSAAPVLMFADSRRQPRFEVFDPYLAFAARYEVTVDGMEHNAFVSQGAIRKDDAVHRNYEAICLVISRFLDAYLKGDAQALAWLRNPPAEGGLLQLRYKAPQPVPPTSAQIVRLYVSEGPSNMQALSALVKNAEPDLLTGCGGPFLRSKAASARPPACSPGPRPFCRNRRSFARRSARHSRQSGTRPARARHSRRRSQYCPKMSPWMPARKRTQGTR